MDNPLPVGPDPIEFNVPGSRSRPTYGGGATVVGGWRKWFAEAGVNYTQSDLSFDSTIDTLLTSVRGGWHGKVGAFQAQAWGGVSYWLQTKTASDQIPLPNGDFISFRIEQEPADPVTGILGANVNLPKNFSLTLETEFAPSTFLISGGATFRF